MKSNPLALEIHDLLGLSAASNPVVSSKTESLILDLEISMANTKSIVQFLMRHIFKCFNSKLQLSEDRWATVHRKRNSIKKICPSALTLVKLISQLINFDCIDLLIIAIESSSEEWGYHGLSGNQTTKKVR